MMKSNFEFSLIKDASADPDKLGQQIFLTFDVDWADDNVIRDTIELLTHYKAKATFFATHSTPVLREIIQNQDFDLGIHPNFNPLLEGAAVGSFQTIIDEMFGLVPDAVCWRSHSLVQSSRILNYAAAKGIKFDCNDYRDFESHEALMPHAYWGGKITKMPHYWEDDIEMSKNFIFSQASLDLVLNKPGLKVFDFHPIHVFLNTKDTAHYESSKLAKGNLNTTSRNTDSYSVRNFLIDLLKRING